MSAFFSNFYVQLYLIIGFATFVLPFLIARRVPKAWADYGYAYRTFLFVLVVLLWPLSVMGFIVGVFKLLRGYYRLRRIARQAMQSVIDDALREDARAHFLAELRKIADAERAAAKAEGDVENLKHA